MDMTRRSASDVEDVEAEAGDADMLLIFACVENESGRRVAKHEAKMVFRRLLITMMAATAAIRTMGSSAGSGVRGRHGLLVVDIVVLNLKLFVKWRERPKCYCSRGVACISLDTRQPHILLFLPHTSMQAEVMHQNNNNSVSLLTVTALSSVVIHSIEQGPAPRASSSSTLSLLVSQSKTISSFSPESILHNKVID